jgi:hypothetical protein
LELDRSWKGQQMAEATADADHEIPLGPSIRFAETSEDCRRMGLAIQLLGAAVESAPHVAWADLFANDLATRACMTMACRQLQAAATLKPLLCKDRISGKHPRQSRALIDAAQ